MFHTAAHRSTTAAQVAINLNAKVDCPTCGGWGDNGIEEESGCRYACYCCGMSGKVTLDEAFSIHADGAKERYEADQRAAAWRAEQKARDEERAARRRAAEEIDYSDDIPF